MYLMKSKKAIEEEDWKELMEKRGKYMERKRLSGDRSSNVGGPSSSGQQNTKNTNAGFQPDELPDGHGFQPVTKSIPQPGEDVLHTSYRDAQYIGSFSVVGEDQASRAEYVRKQLEKVRTVGRSKPVVIMISLSGIKVCSSDKQTVYMAHALKRISYATCDPECRQFSFLAREPRGQISTQYCHAFLTATPEEAEDLNTLVGNAFKMSYAQQRTKRPTFNELIEKQIEEQKQIYEQKQLQFKQEFEKRLEGIATTKVSERVQLRREMRQKSFEEQKEREAEQREAMLNRQWAKHFANKAKHKDPIAGADSASGTFSVRPPSAAMICSPGIANSESKPSQDTSDKIAVNQKRRLGETRDHANASQDLNTKRESNTSILSSFSLANFNSSNSSRGGGGAHGSPVVALKETIDSQFVGLVGQPLGAEAENVPPPVPTEQPENYLYPVTILPPPLDFGKTTEDGVTEADGAKQGKNPMLNRPLPATPMEDRKTPKNKEGQRSSLASEGQRSRSSLASEGQRSRSSWSSEGQRSSYASSSSDSASLAPNYTAHVNGTVKQNVYNTRYQNDSPFRYSNCQNGAAGTYAVGPSGSTGLPLRYDSLRRLQQQAEAGHEDETLKMAPWYQAGIPREIALEILHHEDIGSFIIRDSTTHAGCYALSVKVPKFDNPTGIAHYLIQRTQTGVRLKGLEKQWNNITSLVVHLSVMKEMLPCTLKMPRNSNNPSFTEMDKEGEEDSKTEDPDYHRLTDFHTVMAELTI
ncbi:uncharacterized protein LOC106171873 isoform X2 [Lingula anatina]|uniref:Uncharacterized protein LOC106171873 isoform X2 n=1 Tax=Lingula anatina TaxID=7574 RepID=A0A1S3JD60_LINAN|nr:uncharacterized protein LOC106171873 isoform X2 [Lingula anatina]|eukprot:XP_013407824.1 uncharacterized protein LOC106171873 isoform X2 [Lingula anatina]